MLMNSGSGPARLLYGANGFRIVHPGEYIECAITGEAIALEALRYWCVERQEPYASAQIATRRLTGKA